VGTHTGKHTSTTLKKVDVSTQGALRSHNEPSDHMGNSYQSLTLAERYQHRIKIQETISSFPRSRVGMRTLLTINFYYTMKIQNSKFKIQNSKFKIQNSKFKIQNSKFKIQNSKFKRVKS
jgi:hypothetical protein